MGRAKDWQMEQEERGWFSVSGKYVCPDCFDDDCLKQVVRDNVAASRCDYCGTTAEELTGNEHDLISAPFDRVMRVISEGFQSEWNNADDQGITYESAEGGYQAETADSYDLVQDYVCPTNDDLAQEIVGALPDQVWVKRHYYSLSQDQALRYGWENFCELVKHRNRYMFHLRGRKSASERSHVPSGGSAPADSVEGAEPTSAGPPKAGDAGVESSGDVELRFGIPFPVIPGDVETPDFETALEEEREGISASRMLDAIGETVEQVELIRTLPSSTKLFRGRVGPARKPYRTGRSLGPPPRDKATASRMSPAGIPMFYGTFDEYTAIAETVPGN